MCNAPGVAATRTLSEEKAVGSAQTRKERKVGALPEDCWWYDGYEEDCPAGCVFHHFSRGTGMCNAPGVAATRTLSEEKAVGSEAAVGGLECWDHDGVEEDCPAPCVWRHSSRGYGFCYPSDTAPSNRRTDRVARGCYTLDRANCCKYRDGRMTTDYAESPCVLARTGTFTSGSVCEPRCWADGTCGHSGGGSNVARMGSCGDTETEKAVGAAEKEKAVAGDYSVYAQKTWCRDWDSMSYDSLRTTPKVTYEECKQKCESIPTCNYFLHGERVMDSKMNRCVTWDRCDMRGGYNDGSPTVYERAEWRSPFAEMDPDTVINFG